MLVWANSHTHRVVRTLLDSMVNALPLQGHVLPPQSIKLLFFWLVGWNSILTPWWLGGTIHQVICSALCFCLFLEPSFIASDVVHGVVELVCAVGCDLLCLHVTPHYSNFYKLWILSLCCVTGFTVASAPLLFSVVCLLWLQETASGNLFFLR